MGASWICSRPRRSNRRWWRWKSMTKCWNASILEPPSSTKAISVEFLFYMGGGYEH